MGSSPRMAVVGAGIAGASCAFFLADRGARVTLIERQHPASGPTGKSSALLHVFTIGRLPWPMQNQPVEPS
jgi:glycine/D-amino acid oxidase-like deaminating enzyme